ncbi:MAG: hypothetical protein AAF639_37780 [Chloroflexota bacterium]
MRRCNGCGLGNFNISKYGYRFSRLVNRQIDPSTWLAPPAMLKMMIGGIGSDLKRALTRGANPYAPVPVSELPR